MSKLAFADTRLLFVFWRSSQSVAAYWLDDKLRARKATVNLIGVLGGIRTSLATTRVCLNVPEDVPVLSSRDDLAQLPGAAAGEVLTAHVLGVGGGHLLSVVLDWSVGHDDE